MNAMRTITLAAIAALPCATTLEAADLLPPRPTVVQSPFLVPNPGPPLVTWTGFYIGGQTGYTTGESKYATPSGPIISSGSVGKNGFLGGAHLGYLYAVPSSPLFSGGAASAVLGVEADVDGSLADAVYTLAGTTLQNAAQQNVLGSVRARAGFAFGNLLIYGTGGLAIGDVSNSYHTAANNAYESFSRTRTGYTAGGGAEYALSQNFSLRAEYRYTDLGTVNDAVNLGGVANVTHREVFSRIVGGFSYRFDPPASTPVVARY